MAEVVTSDEDIVDADVDDDAVEPDDDAVEPEALADRREAGALRGVLEEVEAVGAVGTRWMRSPGWALLLRPSARATNGCRRDHVGVGFRAVEERPPSRAPRRRPPRRRDHRRPPGAQSSGRTPIVIAVRRQRAAALLPGRGARLHVPCWAPSGPAVAGSRFICGEPMKAATNRLSGWSYRFCGRVDLLQDALRQHGDAVAHRHRLDLVVGDVDRGDAELALQRGDLGADLHAELGVEVRQRLVHQEHLRLAHDRPAQRDPLALAARELAGLAVEVARSSSSMRGRLAHARSISPSASAQLRARSRCSRRTVMCGYSA